MPKGIAEIHHIVNKPPMEDGYYWASVRDDTKLNGPFRNGSDAAFGALDAGYTPGEKLGEGVIDRICPACHLPIKHGDRIGTVALGPGNNVEEQDRMKQGLPYKAVVIYTHWDCCDPRIDTFAEGSEEIVKEFKS